MITVKNVRTLDDQITDLTIPSSKEYLIEAKEKLLLLPGLIDTHVCLGSIEHETTNWDLTLSSVLRGGFTAVIEIPGQNTSCSNKQSLERKRKMIDKRLLDLNIPLHYFLYAHADPKEIEGLGQFKILVKGILIQLDPKKNEELDVEWDRVFQLAAWENIPLVVNLSNENTERNFKTKNHQTLLSKAIDFAQKASVRLHVLNVANEQEINLIKVARERALLITAETTLYHLFQKDSSKADSLWKALNEGLIETIGSGYFANQKDDERALFRGGNYSFFDPIFFLPRLLTACKEKKITIDKLVRLANFNVCDIFEIEKNHDVILVDVDKNDRVRKISHGLTEDIELTGWPAYIIANGEIFSPPQSGYQVVHS